jgi:RND family efflux transporter MFP subunit
MKRLLIAAVIVAALAGVAFYAGLFSNEPAAQTSATGGSAAGGRGGGGRFGAAGGNTRAPMTVELGRVTRASIGEQITVVGNLVADQTVAVAPRATGRLQTISVRLGDRVTRGQPIAKIEDFELVEQVRQAEAAQEVALATIRQRQADLKLAQTNVERNRDLFQRKILAKQTLDDTEARFQAALAQLDLAQAQQVQSKARLDELRITLDNTVITSPVNGFVARRAVDPGAFVSQNAPVVDVVDIARVRLIVNVVERDLRQLQAGNPAQVQVDAFPGETFQGRIARVSPVLDPTTRTAPLEIEIPNPSYRLRPGMYARVGIATGGKKDALVVPANAVADLGGRRGVFIPQNDTAVFRVVQLGLEQPTMIEVLGGLKENDTVITTGSAALRDGDRILLPDDEGTATARSGRGAADQGRAGRGSDAVASDSGGETAPARGGRNGRGPTPAPSGAP